MNLSFLQSLKYKVKVGFAIAVGEKVFTYISKEDDRYFEGRKALDICWKWLDNEDISGDDLYEIIDNPECTGISEYAEDEEDLNIAKLWCVLVDIVAYAAWIEYKRENAKYLPQALEGISEDSLLVLIESAVETTFITEEEILIMQKKLSSCPEFIEDEIANKNLFISKLDIDK